MGQSTDGILVYGIPLDHEDEPYSSLPWASEEDEDFDDTIARLAGARQYPEDGWLEDKRAAVNACDISLTLHCSCDYSMYILSVRGTELSASRGNPLQIDGLPYITADQKRSLKDWCDKYGIEGDPRWWLCSLWC
jgi:hypothetical protein